MNLPSLVCPDSPALLRTFSGRSVAVRVSTPAEVFSAAESVRNSGNSLLCVIVESNLALDQLELRDEDKLIPLALMVPSAGKFRAFARRISRLREFNVRIFLPCTSEENVAALRILSSLGIETCAVLNDTTKWNAITELMTYGVLDHRVPHARIQPFAYIAEQFDPCAWLNWGRICFDDPQQFLHLDVNGRVALSDAELKRGEFVAESIAEMESASAPPAIKERIERWKSHFLSGSACASCVGWACCLGRFSAAAAEHPGCSSFFEEMIVIARQHKSLMNAVPRDGVWQL